MSYYQHYKNGHIYQILHFARHTETGEEMVVYQGLYDSEEFGNQPIFVRPKVMFFDEVIHEGVKVSRFKELDQSFQK